MGSRAHLLGFDVGSSSIKASLLDASTGRAVASVTSPKTELAIEARRPGWAEQDPSVWWENVVAAAQGIKAAAGRAFEEVAAIGISYQMHGLVLVDREGRLLRPSIIWCDSRAVEMGQRALRGIGERECLSRLHNSPGNFTASKMAWVKENEPEIFARTAKLMLPGDWVAMRMTGEILTTSSGLSECILWDYTVNRTADVVLDFFGIPREMLPDAVPSFSPQGELTAAAAEALGLRKGIPVSYRAGDQPNNAFSLSVLDPGEAASTAGTSGVVYGVTNVPGHDPNSRVNTFVHVNHDGETPRYGVLLCVNGTGILYGWLRRLLAAGGTAMSYDELNGMASGAPVGADSLVFLPFGNGAERTLDNRNPGSSLVGLDFNRHGAPHVLRAAQEGIVFAFRRGLGIMKDMGLLVKTVRAGHSNMFRSPVFGEAFAAVTGSSVELFDTDGAQGAARGAGVGAGLYKSLRDAFVGLQAVKTIRPQEKLSAAYRDAYARWELALERSLG